MLDAFFTCKMWRHKTFRLTNCPIFVLVIMDFTQSLLNNGCFIDHFRQRKKHVQPLNVIALVITWIIGYYFGKEIKYWKNLKKWRAYAIIEIYLLFSSKIVNGKSHFNCISYAIMVTIMNAFISLFKCNMPFWMLKCFYNLHVNALLHLMFVVGN